MIEIACVLVLVGVVVSYLQMRRTWQWWSNRQLRRLHEEAETIRDRLLQDSFAMRRTLETSLIDDPNPTVQGCLEQLNTFHQTLNALSDRLSPPYVQDDLSLAIAHLLKGWETRQANLAIDLALPSVWNQPPCRNDALILNGLDELLRITIPELLTPKVIFVSLSLSDSQNEFKLEIHIPDVEASKIHSDLRQLTQTLCSLTEGHCSYFYQQQTLIWHYRQQRSNAFVTPTCKD